VTRKKNLNKELFTRKERRLRRDIDRRNRVNDPQKATKIGCVVTAVATASLVATVATHWPT
jgi:hypothetical protein